MTIREFLDEVFTAAAASPLCGIPHIRRLTASAINIRIPLPDTQFVDAFFNEVTGRIAFALIEDNVRLFCRRQHRWLTSASL